jgi:prolyl-tRNA editing enzyme YbaK/EbsC (Cys-tRNA(Pro) deacylase)
MTPITDLLDAQGVSYRRLLHREPVFTIEAAARQPDVVSDEMVKAILLRDRSGRYVMACVRGEARVDPAAVRAHLPAHWRRLRFATAAEILEVTGCVQGTVAPLGLPTGVPVLFDEGIALCAKVSIGSGDPAVGLELAAPDLIRMSGARLVRIAADGTALPADPAASDTATA